MSRDESCVGERLDGCAVPGVHSAAQHLSFERLFECSGPLATASAPHRIEDECPWLREDFRAGLAALSASTAAEARRFADDVRLLAGLAAQVPRHPIDDRGATPWTSSRTEVAVARQISDRAAAALVRHALALTDAMPHTLALLTEGRITVQPARAFGTELEGADADVVRLVDEQLAERIPSLSVSRLLSQARRALLSADPDEAARRAAEQNDSRDVVLRSERDDQAAVHITGPAVALARWYAALDRRARGLKAAGDPRTLAQLRFDLACGAVPCAAHDGRGTEVDPRGCAEAGLRPSFVEPASTDCRCRRPVQANITVPVETALGLSNEPGWVEGYGWLSAPACRLLLVDAELRRVCVQAGTGQVVDVAEQDVRPPPTTTGLRHALLDMVVDDITLTGAAGRVEDRHDPSVSLRELVELRDRYCDGPTGGMKPASACELDHERPWPHGPTAAWNLVARATRTPPAQALRVDTAAHTDVHLLVHAGRPGRRGAAAPAGTARHRPGHRHRRPPATGRPGDHRHGAAAARRQRGPAAVAHRPAPGRGAVGGPDGRPTSVLTSGQSSVCGHDPGTSRSGTAAVLGPAP